jgi:hypothetical protein
MICLGYAGLGGSGITNGRMRTENGPHWTFGKSNGSGAASAGDGGDAVPETDIGRF